MVKEELRDGLSYHYSDRKKMIRKVGTDEVYGETYDVYPCPYRYEETDEDMPTDDTVDSNTDLAAQLDRINTEINNLINE